METDKWGRRIRAFRKLKGFTQERLAESLGISVSVFGEIERGTRLPTDHMLVKISEVLGVSVEELTPEDERIK
ncbi:helix-turn-helix domain-containing protein [Lederbergia galactosidilytica]|uniref:XRE family transcriptional regulator n=1 Tax=Lederbergia galactosidilytica TaxID=217031 RepID=A0A0Q9XY93_9BACI|nr:helix-turn-helix transcriptional regulator [Lederbergia galactosidilytica]KRG12867.1 XRE family transcriptional regulator [Virgibacillus soli]KRG13590.1 XRE family transcriptional regulator [Lederbergia galactosidilytica]MBP1916830.1 transcriptional regulator with XRE-family HTH domain [Lederbergia galactosidilytica]OAK72078.1 XRE family transcriptional regulator [Lederbergia galactosidilytica]